MSVLEKKFSKYLFMNSPQVWGTALGTGDTGFTRTDWNPLSLEQTFSGRRRVSENAVCGSGAAGYARHNFPLGDHSGQ